MDPREPRRGAEVRQSGDAPPASPVRSPGTSSAPTALPARSPPAPTAPRLPYACRTPADAGRDVYYARRVTSIRLAGRNTLERSRIEIEEIELIENALRKFDSVFVGTQKWYDTTEQIVTIKIRNHFTVHANHAFFTHTLITIQRLACPQAHVSRFNFFETLTASNILIGSLVPGCKFLTNYTDYARIH